MTFPRPLLAIFCASLFAAPAAAQEAADALPDPETLRGDRITIGLGGGYTPDYEGSDDYRIIPGAVIQGSYKGVSFVTRGTRLYLDVVPKEAGAKVSFDGGPIAGVRLNRTNVDSIDDPRVALLPELGTAIELGAFAGVTLSDVTNPYDQLSLRVDAIGDVNGVYGGLVWGPTLTFATPVSRTSYLSLSGAAEFASDDYADTYFSTPLVLVPDPLSLPGYRAEGGLKNLKISLLGAQSLSGDLLGGFQLFATGSYSRLQGDFADSPIVSIAGSPDQFFFAAGIGYTF